ncbi:hypothetical protein PM082_004282 [Marasmius tenuissimus]|nr:hypothetical protein PM082_004282 [Marasmius tenuissimus]
MTLEHLYFYSSSGAGEKWRREQKDDSDDNGGFSLYTYLVITVIVLLFAFTGIIFRNRQGQRRQSFRRIDAAIFGTSTWHEGGRRPVDYGKEPVMWETRLDSVRSQMAMENGMQGVGDNRPWKPLSIQFLDPSHKANEGSILGPHDITRNGLFHRLISRLQSRSIPSSPDPLPPNESTAVLSSKESDSQPTASLIHRSSSPLVGSEAQQVRLSVFITMPSPRSTVSEKDGDRRDRPKCGTETPDPMTLPPVEIGSLYVWARSSDGKTRSGDGARKEKEPEL